MITNKLVLMIYGRQGSNLVLNYIVGDSPSVAANDKTSLIAVSSVMGDKMLMDLLSPKQLALLENADEEMKKMEIKTMIHGAKFIGDTFGDSEDRVALDKLLAKVSVV